MTPPPPVRTLVLPRHSMRQCSGPRSHSTPARLRPEAALRRMVVPNAQPPRPPGQRASTRSALATSLGCGRRNRRCLGIAPSRGDTSYWPAAARPQGQPAGSWLSSSVPPSKARMTGQWQVIGSAWIPLRSMVNIDHLYVPDWSLRTDAKIIRTHRKPYAQTRRLAGIPVVSHSAVRAPGWAACLEDPAKDLRMGS